MKKCIAFCLMGLAILLVNGCQVQELPSDINVEEEVLKEMAAQQIASVVACVVKGDEIVWEGAWGYADVSDSRPANRQTLYTMMSITKLFLATTVMQLWEEGLIDLEADINQYLPFEVHNPNFPDRKITPYMLLTHTSSLAWPEDKDGIPDFHHFYLDEEVPLISEWLPEYILPGGAYYRNSVWKAFPPGERELYSNIGTSLLALVVEQISGQDFRDLCRENILEPLEMHNSAFRLSNLNESLLATPYTDNNNPMFPYTSRHYPAGWLRCNIEDFSHFIIAFLNYGEYKGKRILERSTVEKMFELRNPASGTAFIWSNCLGDCIGHSGGGTGFSSRAEWYLERDKGMLILSNKYHDSVYPGGRIYEVIRYQCEKY